MPGQVSEEHELQPLPPPRDGRIVSANPATGETIRTFACLTPAELEARLARAAGAFLGWRRTPVAERARLIKRVADILDEERAVFASRPPPSWLATWRSSSTPPTCRNAHWPSSTSSPWPTHPTAFFRPCCSPATRSVGSLTTSAWPR